jgi:hypothetical protein
MSDGAGCASRDHRRGMIREVRRAPFGPGFWPGPRRQARWAGRGLQCSGVGPEDRFCGAVRNDLRVPLTLEGPARTMRGVPTCSLRHFHGSRRTWRVGVGFGRGAGWCGSGIRRGPQAAGYRGCRARQPPRLVGFRPKGAAKAAAPQRRDPRLNPGRLRRVTLAAHSLRLLAPVRAVHGLGGQARRAEGAPLMIVKKILTASVWRRYGGGV